MLVIQQEQLDLWQLSLQLLRDAGMGRPAASSRCTPRAGETRCPALPGAANAVEEEQKAAGASKEPPAVPGGLVLHGSESKRRQLCICKPNAPL